MKQNAVDLKASFPVVRNMCNSLVIAFRRGAYRRRGGFSDFSSDSHAVHETGAYFPWHTVFCEPVGEFYVAFDCAEFKRKIYNAVDFVTDGSAGVCHQLWGGDVRRNAGIDTGACFLLEIPEELY